jgi:hypothetical protein
MIALDLTPLEILGLPSSAAGDSDIIKAAYRMLSTVVHPDVCFGGSGLFKVLTAARDAALNQPLWEPQTVRFQWWQVTGGVLNCGTKQGMLTVLRTPEGWFWTIPGLEMSSVPCASAKAAREMAEAAYLKKFFPEGG